MYVYLYDNFLRSNKFAASIKAIEVSLTDFGIAGKILRLNNYLDVKPIIDDEIKKGARTVVIVGNDRTFGQVLSRGATSSCVYGFVPVGGDNSIAEVLGIPGGEEACTVLAKRRKQKLDVGWINNRYFVSQLKLGPAPLEVVYDERFKASATDLMEVIVCNLKPYFWKNNKKDKVNQVVHPQDGRLEAFLRPLTKRRWFGYKHEEPSIFPFSEMEIRSNTPFAVEADGKRTKEIKVKIHLANHKIDMIVGKDRKF